MFNQFDTDELLTALEIIRSAFTADPLLKNKSGKELYDYISKQIQTDYIDKDLVDLLYKD